jgi:hypothetical protein
MSLVGFEPTTPVFERAKTVHALDRAATVIGFCIHYTLLKFVQSQDHSLQFRKNLGKT